MKELGLDPQKFESVDNEEMANLSLKQAVVEQDRINFTLRTGQELENDPQAKSKKRKKGDTDM